MKSTPLSEVVGANLQQLRTEHRVTTDQLATAARRWGLRWTDSRVSAMERGKIPATLANLIALVQTLEDVLERPVPLSRLLEHDGYVELNSDLALRGDVLVQFVASEPVKVFAEDDMQAKETFDRLASSTPFENLPSRPGVTVGMLKKVSAQSGATEDRIAKDLDIDPLLLALESADLWGRTFSQERDNRAGQDANAQKRGRVSRELKDELRARLDGGDGQ
ncbi:hypothetical protein ACWEQV_12565 [Rhodococcus aetherivorans]|uniref:hypothetical protein n=1 Tax=Rhodococcus sp. GXMU-t2271 TaxID=3059079 RepID=UPI003529F84C